MPRYEYHVTRHSFEMFKELVFYCTANGECCTGEATAQSSQDQTPGKTSVHDLPDDQLIKLKKLLDEHGDKGWELIQIAFGANGFLAFWKRPVTHGKQEKPTECSP